MSESKLVWNNNGVLAEFDNGGECFVEKSKYDALQKKWEDLAHEFLDLEKEIDKLEAENEILQRKIQFLKSVMMEDYGHDEEDFI